MRGRDHTAHPARAADQAADQAGGRCARAHWRRFAASSGCGGGVPALPVRPDGQLWRPLRLLCLRRLRRDLAGPPMTPPPATLAPAPATVAAGGQRRGAAVVLTARQVRRREPSATVWRLLTYDPATRTAVADIACRWQPAGTVPVGGAVPGPVTAWVTAVLGPGSAVGAPADAWAGPDSWHVTTPADPHLSGATTPAATGTGTGGTGRSREGAPVQS